MTILDQQSKQEIPMNNINEMRQRLEMELSISAGWRVVQCLSGDLRALLADHARLTEELRKVNAGETVSKG